MKKKLLAVMLLAGGTMFAQSGFSIGIGVGGHGGGFYQSGPSYAYDIPPCPGPDYSWIDGYWSQGYGRNAWVPGYWYRQPLNYGYRVEPRYDNRFNYRDDHRGYSRGFDRDRGRDFDRHDSGRNQFQNRDRGGDHNRSGGHDNGHGNGFRGR